MTDPLGVGDHSDYGGGGVMPNTVFPKGEEALTAGDKLRLGYITGHEDDSKSRPDPYQFQGTDILHARPLPPEVRSDRQQRQRRQQQIRRDEANRYRETRRPYGY